MFNTLLETCHELCTRSFQISEIYLQDLITSLTVIFGKLVSENLKSADIILQLMNFFMTTHHPQDPIVIFSIIKKLNLKSLLTKLIIESGTEIKGLIRNDKQHDLMMCSKI